MKVDISQGPLWSPNSSSFALPRCSTTRFGARVPSTDPNILTQKNMFGFTKFNHLDIFAHENVLSLSAKS